MTPTIRISRKNEQITTRWSGGTTTELAIHPEAAEYSKRNFTWRISTAVVEAEESLFTHLPGFERILMILDGELFIEHEDQHSATLQPFEQDRFNGGWTTRSKGKVRDFNVMLAEGCTGTLEAIHLQAGIPHVIEGANVLCDEAFYCVHGSITMSITDQQEIGLAEGDFLLLSGMSADHTMAISSQNEATMLRATLFYEAVSVE